VNPFIDGIMIFLFIIFMIFIFAGYHKNKFAQREQQFKKEEKAKEH